MLMKEIKLNSPELKNYTVLGSKNDSLNNCSKINIFVGTNNSGKSRFIREINKIKEYEFFPIDLQIEKATTFAEEAIAAINSILAASGITKYNVLTDIQISSVLPGSFFTIKDNFLIKLDSVFDIINNNTLTTGYVYTSNRPVNPDQCAANLKHYVSEHKDELSEYIKKIKTFETIKKLYIPTMRGLRPPRKGEHNNEYRTRTVADYYDNAVVEYIYPDNEVFTGLELFEHIKRKLLGNLHQRKFVRDFEQYLSENYFENRPIALIPGHDDDVLTVKIGDDDEKKIFDLGDGIQSLIILNYPIFEFVRDNPNKQLLVFVEEPELYIHPGLQRKLLESWNKTSYPNVQFFITSHSHHFLDLTIDFSNTSIYRVFLDKEKDENGQNKFIVENLSSGDKNLLQELGVRNSSVFLANSTIWVEGISDRIYLRKYLELYQKKLKSEDSNYSLLKEDIDYSFVEYGGSNLPHWSFEEENSNDDSIRVSSIVSKIFLVADRDDTHIKTETEKAKRLQKIKELLGDENIFIPNAKEIENIIPWEILKKTIENRGDTIKENIREDTILRNLPEKSLGDYIENHLIEGAPTKKYKAPNSKTINNKADFAKEICKNFTKYDDLSDEAKRLVEMIYVFIIKNQK